MAREEYIRIYRSDVAGATPSLTSGEIAANLVDGKLFVGGTNGSLITFTTDSHSVTGINGLTGNVSITGDGGAVYGVGNNTIAARVATDSVTGVASFSSSDFTVTNGVVSAKSIQINDSIGGSGLLSLGTTRTFSGSGIATRWNGANYLDFVNLGVTSFNGVTGNVSLTGDGGAVQGKLNNTITTRIVTDNAMTGVASFDASHFAVGSSGHVRSKGVITINNTAPDANGNFTVAAATVVTGDGGAVQGKADAFITTRLGSYTLTGIASFDPRHFGIGTSGHLVLTGAYQVTGDTVQAGSAINIGTGKVINNIGVTAFNGVTGAVSLTGDGSGVFGYGNNRVGARLGSYTLTGIASFDPRFFGIGTSGHLVLTGSYQVTGDTVQAGSGIVIGAGKIITNVGVTGVTTGTLSYGQTGVNGILVSSLTGNVVIENTGVRRLTVQGYSAVTTPTWYQTGPQIRSSSGISIVAAWDNEPSLLDPYINISNTGVLTVNGLASVVTITGDGGAVYGISNNTIAVRHASYTLTGAASFDPRFFGIGASGHLVLTGSYQVTGDTVQAGSGIAIGAGKIITNIGVTSFNGVTGNVSLTGDGQAIQGKLNNTITARVATDSLTGVASFSNTYFSVSNGAVSLATAYQATGDTVTTVLGSGIGIVTSGKTDTLYNIGVTSFNGVTGNVSLTGDGGAVQGKLNNTITVRVVQDNAMTGVASFDASHFAVGSSGHVRSKGVITINGQQPDANGNFTVAAATVVTGDGGAIQGKSDAFITARFAGYSATGVASFNGADFGVSTTGSVSLTGNVVRTNVAQVFTANQRFTSGISAADSIYVGSGLTSIELGYRGVGDTLEDPTKHTIIKANDRNGMYLLSSNGGTTASSILLTSGGIALGHNTQGGFATVSIGSALVDELVAVPLSNYTSRIVMGAYDTFNGSGSFTLRTPTSIGSAVDLTLPNVSGTLALTRNLVSNFNGLTGVISLTGDGGAVQGKTNNTITARVGSPTLTGVASFDPRHFGIGATGHLVLTGAYQVTGDTVQAGSAINIGTGKVINNIGVTAFNGLTGSVSLTGDGGAIYGAANNTIGARFASYTLTGIASFDPRHFGIGTSGHLVLTGAYQVTGDTIQAGSAINIGTGKVINNIGVTAFNGLTGAVTLTGDGSGVFGYGNNRIGARLGSYTLTGVASFDPRFFGIGSTGHLVLTGPHQIIGVTGIGLGSDIGLTGKINLTAGSNITITRSGNLITFAGSAGGDTVSDDAGAIDVVTTSGTNKTVTVRPASYSLTGVAYFDSAAFLVGADGYVQLNSGGGPGPLFQALNSGMGVSANADGSLAYLYFDAGNLTFNSATTLDPANDFVLFYDASQTGLLKTKRIKAERILLDNDSVFNSKSTQFVKSKSASNIEFEILTAAVAKDETKLLKSGDAFTYISQNTVKSLNGATGDVTVVGSVNGCTGAIVITGTTNEIVVANSCPNITIGLPDNVSIPFLSGTGATFMQTVTANRFIGTVSGGDF